MAGNNCNSFFSSRVKSGKLSLGLWAFSTIALLIPTCIFLISTSRARSSASQSLDDAKSTYNNLLLTFNGYLVENTNTLLNLVDLNCVSTQNNGFNQNMTTYLNSACNSNAGSLAQLNETWQLTFNEDYNNSTPTTTNVYKNILNGTGLTIGELNCGGYGRKLEIKWPEIVVVNSGLAGGLGVNTSFEDTYSSLLTLNYQIDGVTVINQIAVSPDVNQTQAADDLVQKICQFMVIASNEFNSSGKNYPSISESISNSASQLVLTDTTNQSLQLNLKNIAILQTNFNQADATYQYDSAYWPSMLIVPPLFMALLIFCSFSERPRPIPMEEMPNAPIPPAEPDSSEEQSATANSASSHSV